MSDRFDWSEFRGEEVVPAQRAVIAYLNPDNDVVIRQEPLPYDDEDMWVVIPRSLVPRLIEKLQKLVNAN